MGWSWFWLQFFLIKPMVLILSFQAWLLWCGFAISGGVMVCMTQVLLSKVLDWIPSIIFIEVLHHCEPLYHKCGSQLMYWLKLLHSITAVVFQFLYIVVNMIVVSASWFTIITHQMTEGTAKRGNYSQYHNLFSWSVIRLTWDTCHIIDFWTSS